MGEVSGKRATNVEQKKARKDKVLAAAMSLFLDAGFFDVSMSMIAKKTGIAKGTLYLYFKTKEEIFLALCTGELSLWLQQLETELSQVTGTLENNQFIEILRNSFDQRKAMCRLISLMHLVLEKNVPYEEVLSFKRNLLAQLLRIGALVEDVLPYLNEGQGIVIMTNFHCLVVGWSQMTDTSPLLERVLENPEMAPFRFQMQDSLFQSFKLVLDGAKAANGDAGV